MSWGSLPRNDPPDLPGWIEPHKELSINFIALDKQGRYGAAGTSIRLPVAGHDKEASRGPCREKTQMRRNYQSGFPVAGFRLRSDAIRLTSS